MPPETPDFATDLAVTTADLSSSVQISVGGTRVPIDLSAGSVFLAFCRNVCLIGQALYGLVNQTAINLTFATATGTFLDAIVALLGLLRIPATYGITPVKVLCATPPVAPLAIPVGAQFVATDASGAPTLFLSAAQDPTQPIGTSGVAPIGSTGVWIYAQATTAGTAGNLTANRVVQLATQIAGFSGAANPPVATPGAPTGVVGGTPGSTTYRYVLVAHGVTGITVPSAVLIVSTGNATLSGGNNIALTWAAVPDAMSYDVVRSADGISWFLVTTQAITTYTDVTPTSALTTIYPLPLTNTTNSGYGGVEQESDARLRTRAQNALLVQAAATRTAIADTLLAIPGVAQVFLSVPAPGTLLAQIVGTTMPLSAAIQAAIADALDTETALGIVPSWLPLVSTPVDVAFIVTARADISPPSSLVTPVEAAITAYFLGLAIGAAVSYAGVISSMGTVSGVATVNSLVFSVGGTDYGTSQTDQDTPESPGVLYSVGTLTATVLQ